MVATRRTPAKKKAKSPSRSPSPAPRKKTPAKRRSTVKKATPGPGKELVGQRVEILWEAEKAWYGGTISKYNSRAGTHTIDYDDGETYIHDLSKTKYKSSKVDTASTSTAAPADTGAALDAELVAALLPQDGDCVSIKWAGAPACICILRKDKIGDLIPYPVDGSWEDENLVFDANKDEWEWPSDDAFSSVEVKPAEVDDREDDKEAEEIHKEEEAEEEEETVPATDDGLNTPMHSLGTTVKLVVCAVAVGVACFFVDPEESEKLIKYVQTYTSE